MKKLLIMAILVLTSGVLFSQNQSQRGKTQLNLGVGFSGWGIPLYIGFDHGVSNDITLGAELSYRAYNENWHQDKYHHSIVGLSGNANYHFNRILNIPPQWDFYAGLNLGFFFWSSPEHYDGDHTSGIGLGGQVGARYYFNNKVGINLEFGGGNAFSGGKIGLTFVL